MPAEDLADEDTNELPPSYPAALGDAIIPQFSPSGRPIRRSQLRTVLNAHASRLQGGAVAALTVLISHYRRSVVTGSSAPCPAISCFTSKVARDEEVTEFQSAAALEDWLARHHASSGGFWLKLKKNAPGEDVLTYAQALDVALCYGWIDGQKGKLDDAYWLQRFTPRSARSKWSKINREKAAALIEQGRMAPPGLAEVERAKADGRWEAAYAGAKSAAVPADLAKALEANPAAAEFFKTLDSRNRYSILYRVQDAKKPETRARRIETFVDMLANHEKIHP